MLEVIDVCKKHGEHEVLHEISISIAPGEVVAFVGPNGAGKTSLFTILAGVSEQTSGSCTWEGVFLRNLDPSTLSFLAEHPYRYEHFTALEMVLFEKNMREIDADLNEVMSLFDEFGIVDFANTKMMKLSQGTAKKVSLVSLFLANSPILILDEPLNGLDIQSVIVLKEKIAKASHNGTCVLISSHVLTFFDSFIDRALFLQEGRIVHEAKGVDGSSEDIYKKLFL